MSFTRSWGNSARDFRWAPHAATRSTLDTAETVTRLRSLTVAPVAAVGTPTAENAVLVTGLGRLGWSPDRLAREINRVCGPGTISNKAPYHWVRGVKPRAPLRSVVAMILSEQLGETIEVADLWPDAAAGVRMVWSSADGQAPGWSGDAVLAAIDWLAKPVRHPGPHRDGPAVDAGIIAALGYRVEQLRALDERGSGALLIEWGVQDLKWAQRLAARASYDLETAIRLDRVIAELAQLVGMLCADANQWENARKYLVIALGAAAKAGDRALGGYIVSCLSGLCLSSGALDRAGELIRIARKGCAGLPPSPGLALVVSWQARMHALRGEAQRCRSRVDEARRLLACAAPAAFAPWNSWVSGAVLLGDAGHAWLDLGLLDEAEHALRTAVDELGETLTVLRAVHLMSLAQARLRLGRGSAAADAALEALALSRSRDSARCRTGLARLRFAFVESKEPAAREAAQHIARWLVATR